MSQPIVDQGIPLKTLAYFAEIIRRELGIIYDEKNYFQLEIRLKDLARAHSNGDVELLMQDLMNSKRPEFKAILLESATNNETSFFRDTLAFDALLEVLRNAAKNQSILRVWSAACSFGQEPYTLAMLADILQRNGVKIELSILATDYSKKALAYAQAGVYSDLQIRQGLSPELLNRYFRPSIVGEQEVWTVDASLRRNMSFQHLNLLDPVDKLGNFDFILCRNVLIYQNVENKRKILERMYEIMRPGGYLLMGAAESLLGVTEKFEMHRINRATLYRRPE